MNPDRRSISNASTAAPPAQSAKGLPSEVICTGGHPPGDRENVFAREMFDTPRRYDQPIEEDDDPVMPSDEPTLNTKI